MTDTTVDVANDDDLLFIIILTVLSCKQRAALRQQLHNLLEQQEQQQLEHGPTEDYYYADNDKRSVAQRLGVVRYGKRNLAQLLHASPNIVLDEMKRSLASLAKTGQLPSKEPDAEDGQLDADSLQDRENKRSLSSLARTGNLLQSGGKRNLASLRKNDMMPLPLVAANGQKRTLSALARGNMLPMQGGGQQGGFGGKQFILGERIRVCGEIKGNSISNH